MSGSTSSFKKAGSSFPTDQAVTCSHITIICRGADELRRTIHGRVIVVLVGVTNLGAELICVGGVLVVLGFFELDVGVIAVYRTIRSDKLLWIFLGVKGMRRRAVPVTLLVPATDLDAPNSVGTE